jgi:NTE family protein
MQKEAPTHLTRSKATDFERVALLLQGGGALGSYQAGVYQALAEADLHPDCISGVSIGAINAALIAGNAPRDRVKALRSFWERITSPPLGYPYVASSLGYLRDSGDALHGFLNRTHALLTVTCGAPGFFKPNLMPPLISAPGSLHPASFYDTSPLKATLEELVDFERINSGRDWFSVGAVNVRTGNLEYFDSTTGKIRPEHILASGALPPGFPAIEIDGEYYWDGGIVSNTPLQWVLNASSRKDTLAFQVDLWSARGDMPGDLINTDLRLKDIRYSSRTRAATDQFRSAQRSRRALRKLLDTMPDHSSLRNEDFELLDQGADDKAYNIVHLIYRAKQYEGSCKDYEFSRGTMEEHWAAGYADAVHTLKEPAVLQLPNTPDGLAVFDLTR